MARDKKPNPNKINYWLDNIQNSMNRLYKNTYYSDKSNVRDMDSIIGGIENDISTILQRNKTMDISGISKLYSKAQLNNVLNDKSLEGKVKELFEDNPLTDELLASYLGNKWIRDIDAEVDTVLRYVPKMGEALDLIRDAVLSSDSFSKDFINPKSPFSSDDLNTSVFQSRTDSIVKKYKLLTRLQEWYDEASRHGEQFLYIVPYNKAIASLLNNKDELGIVNNIHESTSIGSKTSSYDVQTSELLESSLLDSQFSDNDKDDIKFKVIFDRSCTLRSCISEAKYSHSVIEKGSKSLYENYTNESSKVKNIDAKWKDHLDSSIPDDIKLPKDIDSGLGVDGFVSKTNKKVSAKDLKIKGAVVKRLKRENIIPLYVEDDICLGYYYLEFDKEIAFDFYTASDRYGDGRVSQGITSTSRRVSDNLYQDEQIETIIMNIASKISQSIDKTFVNANQDLTKEIYAVLKSNEIFSKKYRLNSMRVSFLPEEDVHRLAFNVDPDTHRGVSDCAKGLIPAKLYACLYITDTIGDITRGQDKRVYYVKQTVDTNISQTLMNVINQIKKSNFNIRQIENINNILNITGKFNDYVIPVGPSGDSPIQFEVMPGQQFEPKTDLMNTLEEMAVNSTGCPLELVQARMSPDFATQFTSSSIKILRFVYGRQGVVQDFIGEVLTKIYNCEYDDLYTEIECELPPPMFLNLTNTSQLIQNAQEHANLIAEFEYSGEQSEDVDQKKAIFIRKYIRWLLSSYIKSSTIDRLKEVAEMELKVKTPSSDTTSGSGDSGEETGM